MESYIVRVLRRQQTNQYTEKDGIGKDTVGKNRTVHLDGVVETIDEDGGYRAFHSVDELWSILTGSDRGTQSGEIQSKGGRTTRTE